MKRRASLVEYTTGSGRRTIAFANVPPDLVGATLERAVRRQTGVLVLPPDASRPGGTLFRRPRQLGRRFADIINTAPNARNGRMTLSLEIFSEMGDGYVNDRLRRLADHLTQEIWTLRKGYET